MFVVDLIFMLYGVEVFKIIGYMWKLKHYMCHVYKPIKPKAMLSKSNSSKKSEFLTCENPHIVVTNTSTIVTYNNYYHKYPSHYIVYLNCKMLLMFLGKSRSYDKCFCLISLWKPMLREAILRHFFLDIMCSSIVKIHAQLWQNKNTMVAYNNDYYKYPSHLHSLS